MNHDWVEDKPYDNDGRKTFICVRCGLEKDTWDEGSPDYWLKMERVKIDFMTCAEIIMKEVME